MHHAWREHKPTRVPWEPPETVVPGCSTCPGGKSRSCSATIHEERVTGTTSCLRCLRPSGRYDFARGRHHGGAHRGSALRGGGSTRTAAPPRHRPHGSGHRGGALRGNHCRRSHHGSAHHGSACNSSLQQQPPRRHRRHPKTNSPETTLQHRHGADDRARWSRVRCAQGPIVLPDGTKPTTLTDTVFACKDPIGLQHKGARPCNAKTVCPGGNTCDTTDNRCKVSKRMRWRYV